MNVSALVLSSKSPDRISKTRLDSHAVSTVVGYNAYIWRDTGKTVSVSGWSKGMGSQNDVPIVDAMLLYECPNTNRKYLLMIYNALYQPDNDDNLLTPFLVREAGVTLSEIPKIHQNEPSIEDHCLYFDEEKLRIHLQLTGIVSYFPTRKPTIDEISNLPRIDLTPDAPSWDPYDISFARREECMLDFEGNIIEKRLRDQQLFPTNDDTDYDDMDFEINRFDSHIAARVDQVCENTPLLNDGFFEPDLLDEDVTDDDFAAAMNARLAYSTFAMNVGCLEPDNDFVIGATHQSKPKGIRPERLAKVFKIDIPTAKKTIGVTSQSVKRVHDPSLTRNFNTNDRALRYARIKDHFFMDTLIAAKKGGKSRRGNTCMQLFVTDKGYVYVVPMKHRRDAHKAMKMFLKRVGAPDAIVCDGAKEFYGETKKLCNEAGTTLRHLERGTPWSNRAELYIGIIKKAVKRDLQESDCPMCLWDYCAERLAKVNNVTAKDLFQLEGQTPEYHVTGKEPDISNICQFEWYQWVYFYDGNEQFPGPTKVLGRALGPAINAGNEMAQWVLKCNGQVVPRRTCRELNTEELNSPVEAKKREIFDKAIRDSMGSSINPPPDDMPPDNDKHEPYEDDEESPALVPESDYGAYDELISAELNLPHEDDMKHATVVRRSKGRDGSIQGSSGSNPMMDTRVYDVMFDDGTVKQYSANIIAENMYAQIDADGRHSLLMDSIIDHRCNEHAVTHDNMYVVTKRGNKQLRKTTIGWELKVLWKDGSTDWISLKDLKESNPVNIAEYAVAHKIDKEPAFLWWVPYTLRKRDVIVAAINARVTKATHKYGIRVPQSVKEALAIDKENGNTLWQDAIAKEMSNVMVAFDILEENQNLPPGYTKASGHIIFEVKMDFRRKARYVKDGHRTPDPVISTYAGVVSRESVRIALTYAALNDIDVNAADIRNAYLQAPASEKHYIICGREFGIENMGKRAIIIRALYGGKTSGRDFRNSLRSCMEHIGFKSCLADPDVRKKAEIVQPVF